MSASSPPFLAPDDVRRPDAHGGIEPRERELSLHLADLCCRDRGRHAEDVLRRVPGVRAAKVRWRDERADVRVDAGRTSERDLTSALADAGHRARPASARTDAKKVGRGALLWALAVAAFAVEMAIMASRSEGRVRVVAELALAAIAVGAALASLGPRAVACARRGILDRDALAIAGALGALAVAARDRGSGSGVAACAIAAAAVVARAAEDALSRAARRDLPELDACARTPPEAWDDALVQGVITAALGCASFALVTHACVGEPPLGPRAIGAAIAVLVAGSPSAFLAAGSALHGIGRRRAQTEGATVLDAAALTALASAEAICLPRSAMAGGASGAVRALAARGVRPLLAPNDGPIAAALGARSDVSIALVGTGAQLALGGRGVEALPALVDLSRALARARRGAAVLAVAYHAAIIPAATLGLVPPAIAAGLSLAATLLLLANAARLLPRKAIRPAS